jgi:hypothetical protein
MPAPRSLGEVFGQSLSQFAIDYPRFVQLKQAEAQRQEQIDFQREITLEQLGLSQEAGGRAERQLGLGEQAGFRAQGQFEAERDAPPEPLTEAQQFEQFLQQNPEDAQRLFQARIAEAELKGQPKPEKGPGLSARVTAGKERRGSEVRRLSGDVMERFEKLDPGLVDELIGGGSLPSEDPFILESLSRRFLGEKDKPYWFTGDTTITDSILEAKLDTLNQVFARPALEFEGNLTGNEKSELGQLLKGLSKQELEEIIREAGIQ